MLFPEKKNYVSSLMGFFSLSFSLLFLWTKAIKFLCSKTGSCKKRKFFLLPLVALWRYDIFRDTKKAHSRIIWLNKKRKKNTVGRSVVSPFFRFQHLSNKRIPSRWVKQGMRETLIRPHFNQPAIIFQLNGTRSLIMSIVFLFLCGA